MLNNKTKVGKYVYLPKKVENWVTKRWSACNVTQVLPTCYNYKWFYILTGKKSSKNCFRFIADLLFQLVRKSTINTSSIYITSNDYYFRIGILHKISTFKPTNRICSYFLDTSLQE